MTIESINCSALEKLLQGSNPVTQKKKKKIVLNQFYDRNSHIRVIMNRLAL